MQQAVSRTLRASCAAAAAALVLAAHAQAPLTLAEAQRLAIERSRQLAAIGLGVAASREMAVAAGELPDPVLSVGVENLPVEGMDRWSLTRDFMTMRRIGLMQEWTRKEKRELRAERYELEARKGLAEGEMARANVHRDTALAWLDTFYAEAQAAAIAEQRVRGLQEAQAAEAEYRAGRGSQPEVLMARANLAMLDDRAAEIELKVRTARTLLARWTGIADPRAPLAAKPDIHRVNLDLHGLDEKLERHPEIEVLSRQAEIAASEARLARANKTPDVSFELAYNVRGSMFGDMVSVGVSVPLAVFQKDRQDREHAARLALAEQARAQRDEAARSHAAEVRAMLHEWDTNRSRLARFEREIVPLSAARAEATLAAFRGGRTTVNDVLAARRGELEARLQALQVESEIARAWARLNFLVVEASK